MVPASYTLINSMMHIACDRKTVLSQAIQVRQTRGGFGVCQEGVAARITHRSLLFGTPALRRPDDWPKARWIDPLVGGWLGQGLIRRGCDSSTGYWRQYTELISGLLELRPTGYIAAPLCTAQSLHNILHKT